jgi:hypothetical protein
MKRATRSRQRQPSAVDQKLGAGDERGPVREQELASALSWVVPTRPSGTPAAVRARLDRHDRFAVSR